MVGDWAVFWEQNFSDEDGWVFYTRAMAASDRRGGLSMR